MSMNVFEINQAIRVIQEKDLDPEVLADTLDSLQITRDEKLDGVAGWIESNNAKIDWLELKLKQLREVKTRLTNQNKRLNSFLTDAIDDAGLKSIKTEHHILKPRNYRASTVVEDVKQLPIDYVVREEVLKADKKKIYEDLAKGKEVSGAYLKPNRKTVIE